MRDLIGTMVDLARSKRPSEPPVPYASRAAAYSRGYGLLGRGPRDQQAQMDAYGSVGTLFGIVNRTSTSTAAVEWKLWRKAKSGKEEDRTPVTSHLALDIWNKPNDFYTQRDFVEAEQQHLDLTGEGWWVIVRSELARSIPLELWPVRPDRMRPVPDPKTYLRGYMYTSPDGEEIALELDQVIQLKMPHPTDPYRGCGPVQALLTSLDTAKFTEEWNRNFFLNSAEPGGIIEVENSLSDAEFDEMSERWAEQHKGVANAHRVAIIEQGKWVNRTFTMRDMQFAELAEVSDAKLLKAFGMSKFAIGQIDDVNRATAEASKAWFAEALTIPRLDRIKDALNYRWLPMFGATATGLEFDYEDPVPPDAESRDRERTSKANAAKTYVDAGYDGDSVKDALELPEALKWEKPKPPAPPAAPGQVPGAQPPAEDDDQAATDRAFAALTAHLLPAPLIGWRPLNDAEVASQVDLSQVQEDWETALDQLVADWQEQVTPAQMEELEEQIEAAVTAGDLAALAALVVSSAVAAQLTTAAMVALAGIAAVRVVEEAAAQGVVIAVGVASAAGLAAVAAAVAALLAAGLAQAAGREALRRYNTATSGRDVARAVVEWLAELGDTTLRVMLGGALSRGQNAGRAATMGSNERAGGWTATWYASEVLDKNTCSKCSRIDGKKLPTVEAMILAYGGNGGYLLCEGRERCRGMPVAVWSIE